MKRNIIVYSIICLLILYVIEQILMAPYIVKTVAKLPMFLIFPFLLNKYILNQQFSIKIKRTELRLVIFWSILVFLVIFVAYFILSSFINIEAISSDFSDRLKISNKALIITGLYTIIINSIIEEYFFRGFIFQGLLKQGWIKGAYFFSSILFAIYHVSIFKTWFNMSLMFVMLVGLFAGGLIFSFFVKKTESILASWFIHLSADLAIVIIGFKMLGILFS